MSSLQLDQDGDLQITNNRLTLTSGVEAIRQHMQVRFRMFLGEWFLDTSKGVPWFQEVLKKNVSLAVVQEILKDVALSTPGVIQLLSFDMEYSAPLRQLGLNFQALTSDGVIDFSQTIEL